MKLSVVIVNWNTRQLLADCLESLVTDCGSLEDGRAEIWVVDNASDDGSSQMVRQEFPQVQLIENRENAGFAQANNQAIRRSRSHYVLLLNPDTVVLPGALTKLVSYLDEHPEVGAAGACVLNPDGSLQISCYPAPTLLGELARLLHVDKVIPYGSYHMMDWNRDEARPVDVLLGACLLLRQTALQQVGLLDEDYFMYSEELDLCTRLRQGRWQIYWVPQAQIIHYGGQSTRQAATPMFLQLYYSKLMYFRKRYGLLQASLYRLVLILVSVVRIGLLPLACLLWPAHCSQNWALAGRYSRLVWTLLGLRQAL